MKPIVMFDELKQALSALAWSHSFWSTLLYEQLTIVIDETVGTLAVGGGKLYINQGYFCDPKFDSNNRIFMIAHEIGHEMLLHPELMAEYQASGFEGEPFDLFRFNMAGDYCINALLIATRVGQYHPDWLHSKHFTFEDNVFDVYRRLRPKNPPPQTGEGEQGEGEGGQGNGQGSPADGQSGNEPESETPSQPQQYDILDEDGNVVDETPAGATPQDEHKFDDKSPHSAADWKQAVAGAHQQAKSIGHGSAALDRFVTDYIETKRDWRKELRDYVVVSRGRSSLNWKRPHKRKMRERRIPMPTRLSYDMGKVLYVFDVSGSVSPPETQITHSACVEIATDCVPESIRVMSVASHVVSDDTYDNVEEFMAWKPTGTGGTDMEAAFRLVEEEGWEPELAIVLTDGHTYTHEEPKFPVVWISTQAEPESFNYGHVIMLPPQ